MLENLTFNVKYVNLRRQCKMLIMFYCHCYICKCRESERIER